MYIASPRAQFKINTHGCWNWHLCIPDGLSVVQCSLGHVIGIVFLTQFQWHEAIVLDNWQLAVLPGSGGRDFNPHRVHDIVLFLCEFICASLCQSIKIKPTNMYIASARVQFKIDTHGCWNWHLCIPVGLSIVQCSLRCVIGVVCLTYFQWHEAIVLC